MRYAAFLSYSHADARWAKWLLRRLESYRVPARLVGTQGAHGPIGNRLGRIFRDRDELPTAGDLGDTIREALAASDALVVICSPQAAQSRWVNAEAEAFRALGRGDRIACFIVDGDPSSEDPATACFPAAATAPGPDGMPREPLAADARKSGDGRERAFLKLVAGLLGVSYDALAQREAQRRHRRMFAITTAALVGMAIAIGLAATAYVARNDAQRRQAQAEDILGFMLGDLREKLTTVGRLDLMRAVDDKATEYFSTLDPRDLSDRALEEQARSLTGIGQVRLGEGDHDAAMHAFREALARSTALHERAPANGQRLYDLAQAEFWIGFVAFEQGDYDTAEVWQRRYHASAVRLAAMDRDNFDWQLEVAYGLHNLAVMDERRARYEDAERSVREEIDLYRRWMRERPDDLTLRANAADAMSWLGTLMVRQGQLAASEPYFREQVEALRRNVTDDPGNATWKDYSVRAMLLLTDAQAQRGRLDEARASIATATPLAAALSAQDPANNSWRTWHAACLWWKARLSAGSDLARAVADASAAESLLRQAHDTEPRNQRILTWLVRSHQLLARLALARDDVSTARAQAGAAHDLIEPAWAAEQNDQLRVALAETRVLEGVVAARDDRKAQAVAAWEGARELLLPVRGSDPAFDRLDPLVRTLHHLGRHDEARRYMERLEASGYVPLEPWPRSAGTLAWRGTP